MRPEHKRVKENKRCSEGKRAHGNFERGRGKAINREGAIGTWSRKEQGTTNGEGVGREKRK